VIRESNPRSPRHSEPACTTPSLTLSLAPEALEAIAQRAAAIVIEQLGGRSSPWLTRSQAAEHLHVPVSRLEKDRSLPFHRWDGRVLYHREEIDQHLRRLPQDG
jgi:hypothetical protein